LIRASIFLTKDGIAGTGKRKRRGFLDLCRQRRFKALLSYQENVMQLEGRAAIVTGGASGLGAAAARKLAAQGARVAVCDINTKLAEELAKEIGGTAVTCDVSDAASGEAAMVAAAKVHGPARVLVNCAGIGLARRVVGREGPHALADFNHVVRVNLIGSFNMLRLAATDMSKLEPLEGGERGVVINTASIAAYDGQIGQAAYSASKGGIVGMTLPIARELAQFGIRVLTIAPGLFLTPLLGALPQAARDSLASAIPFPHRLARRIRIAGNAHDRQSLSQRRSRAAGCRAAHGAEIICKITIIEHNMTVGTTSARLCVEQQANDRFQNLRPGSDHEGARRFARRCRRGQRARARRVVRIARLRAEARPGEGVR
jgi:NAD(P)-dependent dehydrogenase (short-subunit alcohol dehydrogenase family)